MRTVLNMNLLKEGTTMQKREIIQHPFPPLYDAESRILILGSFPSVKSREQRFFYGHPQNRFWKVMAAVCNASVPQTIQEKKDFLHKNHIALWDSVGQCSIIGSSDSSIEDVIPNNISSILENAPICAIFCNGKKSLSVYQKYVEPKTGHIAAALPSTSPANAAWTLDRLIASWSNTICPYLFS